MGHPPPRQRGHGQRRARARRRARPRRDRPAAVRVRRRRAGARVRRRRRARHHDRDRPRRRGRDEQRRRARRAARRPTPCAAASSPSTTTRSSAWSRCSPSSRRRTPRSSATPASPTSPTSARSTCATSARASRSPSRSTPGEDLRAAFEAAYVRAHGRKGPDVPIEAISWRVLTRGPDPDLRARRRAGRRRRREEGHPRRVLRRRLRRRRRSTTATGWAPGTTIEGPAIVEERESTTRRRPGRHRPRGRGRQPDHRGERMTLDPVTVGIAAGRLASILDEQQATLVRTAFSTIVRESEDLACGVFDRAGRMLGQSHSGTPGPHQRDGHRRRATSSTAYPPETLEPGDVLVTNDPWMTAGQINDLTVATPVFRGERMIGLFASTCHAPDIGGRLLSAEASDVYEEGLRLPIMKLARAGEMNEDLLAADPRQRPHAARDGRRPLRPGRGQRRRRPQPAALPRRPRTRGPRGGRRGDPPPLRDGDARGDRASSPTAATRPSATATGTASGSSCGSRRSSTATRSRSTSPAPRRRASTASTSSSTTRTPTRRSR